jgi:hypothetical protein
VACPVGRGPDEGLSSPRRRTPRGKEGGMSCDRGRSRVQVLSNHPNMLHSATIRPATPSPVDLRTTGVHSSTGPPLQADVVDLRTIINRSRPRSTPSGRPPSERRVNARPRPTHPPSMRRFRPAPARHRHRPPPPPQRHRRPATGRHRSTLIRRKLSRGGRLVDPSRILPQDGAGAEGSDARPPSRPSAPRAAPLHARSRSARYGGTSRAARRTPAFSPVRSRCRDHRARFPSRPG